MLGFPLRAKSPSGRGSRICKRKDAVESSGRTYRPEVVARIVRSTDGGPLRQIAKGRSTRPTGTFVAVKAGGRAMPWESMKCELPVLELAEVASSVVDLMAQPHRLELFVRGKRRPLVYFPDFELTVEPTLYSRLMAKEPFAQAVLEWRPDQHRRGEYRKVVIEVKDDADPRNDDREYQTKLRLAASVYQKIGIGFVIAIRSQDIECVDLNLVHRIALDRYTAISATDVHRSVEYLQTSGGRGVFGRLVEELGGGRFGRAKAAALHVRRMISVDIRQGLHRDAPVSLLSPLPPSGQLPHDA